MKYPVYSAFVSALLVSPLILAVGCSAKAGDACAEEGSTWCSGTGDEVLICSSAEDGSLVLISHMECIDGTICEHGAEGAACVPESGTGGYGGYGGSAGSGGSGINHAPVINYVGWEYPPECAGFGDSELTVTISAFDEDDPSGDSLTYSGTVDWCTQDIDIKPPDSSSLVQQTLDCVIGSLTSLSVTVKDPQGAEETVSAMWESAICEEQCTEGDEPVEDCPSPWPDD